MDTQKSSKNMRNARTYGIILLKSVANGCVLECKSCILMKEERMLFIILFYSLTSINRSK